MVYDYLLVGHGLAGAILAQTLQKQGFNILVIDVYKANSASNVAAGLINPVAGKRFAKSWLADTFVPFAETFYRALETELNSTFFHQKPILKLFSTIEEQNNWMGKSADNQWNEYIEATYAGLPVSEEINQEFGGIKIKRGGFVETARMLQLLREKHLENGTLLAEKLDFSQLEISGNGITYKNIQAKNIIFCEGFQATQNPYFNWLPFSLNKGELLEINVKNLPSECIYNKGVYVVPVGETNWKVGATYNWRQPDEHPTAEGYAELTSRLQQLVKIPVQVTGHQAGIRPAVRDRKPLIGTHPEIPAVHIFNGMGSKGVLMAPYLAYHFGGVLQNRAALLPEADINRFRKLYSERGK